MIDDRVRLIAITWVPDERRPCQSGGRGRAHRACHGVPFLLDACQAVGQMPVDVTALGCDMLSATGRKFLRGPRGTGFLYVRRELMRRLEPPMIDHFAAPWVRRDRYELRPDARRFENWENNYAARLGLGAAIDYALAIGIEPIMRALPGAGQSASQRRLRRFPGVTVHDLGRDPAAIVTFSVAGIEAERRAGASRRGGDQRQHIKSSSTLLDATARALPVVVRASPHYYNTEDEIDRADERRSRPRQRALSGGSSLCSRAKTRPVIHNSSKAFAQLVKGSVDGVSRRYPAGHPQPIHRLIQRLRAGRAGSLVRRCGPARR